MAPIHLLGCRVQIRILAPQSLLIGRFSFLLAIIGTYGTATTVAVNDSAPRVAIGVVADAFCLALGISPDAMVLPSFLLGHDLQICSPAIQTIVV